MVYDASRDRVVLFGGQEASGAGSAATWEWDGSTWSLRASTGPSARWYPAMAYDPLAGKVVLFGGYTAVGANPNDTWQWDGTVWQQRAPLTSPSARAGATLVADARRGRLVLFGGEDDNFGRLGDTWEWDGNTWTQASSSGPAARFFHSSVYDSTRGYVVTFGGITGLGRDVLMNDVWAFDGSWRAIPTSAGPSARASQEMAYDSLRDRVVLFGGYRSVLGNPVELDDTWELGP